MRGAMAGLFLAVSATAAAAGPFDGLYSPEGWDCRTVGSDGGAIMVQDDQFHGVESLCRLKNPTRVNGMSAVLYDADCDGEGMSYGYRMMLMKVPEGLAVIQDGNVSLLRTCP